MASLRSASLTLSIPYNLVNVNDREVGLDSYFWNSLSKPFRVVLLIRGKSVLSGEPRGYRVSPRVSLSEQLSSLSSLSSKLASTPEGSLRRVAISKILGLRLLALILPSRRLIDKLSQLSLTVDMEERLALEMLKLMSKASIKGLRKTLWLNIDVRRVGEGISVSDRVYSTLYSIDPTFRQEFDLLVEEVEGNYLGSHSRVG